MRSLFIHLIDGECYKVAVDNTYFEREVSAIERSLESGGPSWIQVEPDDGMSRNAEQTIYLTEPMKARAYLRMVVS